MKENKPSKMKEAKSGNVFKFEKIGDSIAGKIVALEESKMYENSWALKLQNPAHEEPIVVFINKLIYDKLMTNQIGISDEILINYVGTKVAKESGREYRDFEVFYTKAE